MIEPQLDALTTAGLIRFAQEQPGSEYLFRHALVQAGACQSLLKQNRRAELCESFLSLPAVQRILGGES